MKINVFFLGFYLWMISIFSVFLPIKFYIPLFIIFIVYVIITQLILNPKLNIKDAVFSILIFLFLFFGGISYFANIDVSNSKQLVKMIVNLLFLLSSVIFINKNYPQIQQNLNKLGFLFELIILLSFIQIVINVRIMDLWMVPFRGVTNKQAYLIAQPPVYFGSASKNIWATKIAFIQIIYLTLIHLKLLKASKGKIAFMSVISLFNIIYTTSRTAQLLFLVPILYFIFLYLMSTKYVALKYFLILGFGVFAVIVSGFVYDKLMHFSSNIESDGLFMRFRIWKLYLEKFQEQRLSEYLIGNGILYGDIIIQRFMGRAENNLHNVFLNTLADTGFVGLILYTSSIIYIFFRDRIRKFEIYRLVIFFLPFFICINSQYIGYDNDLIIYLSGVFLVTMLIKNRQQKVENFEVDPQMFKSSRLSGAI